MLTLLYKIDIIELIIDGRFARIYVNFISKFCVNFIYLFVGNIIAFLYTVVQQDYFFNY